LLCLAVPLRSRSARRSLITAGNSRKVDPEISDEDG